MTTLKLIATGPSTAVVLPKEMLAHLGLKQGDVLYATEIPEGFLLTAADAMGEAGRAFIKENRQVFKGLAE